MPAPASHLCPICGRPAPPPEEGESRRTSFPFCSPGCKLVDLGRWLDGNYRVPGPPVESSLDREAGDGE